MTLSEWYPPLNPSLLQVTHNPLHSFVSWYMQVSNGDVKESWSHTPGKQNRFSFWIIWNSPWEIKWDDVLEKKKKAINHSFRVWNPILLSLHLPKILCYNTWRPSNDSVSTIALPALTEKQWVTHTWLLADTYPCQHLLVPPSLEVLVLFWSCGLSVTLFCPWVSTG